MRIAHSAAWPMIRAQLFSVVFRPFRGQYAFGESDRYHFLAAIRLVETHFGPLLCSVTSFNEREGFLNGHGPSKRPSRFQELH
jgi:hypothetical protein